MNNTAGHKTSTALLLHSTALALQGWSSCGNTRFSTAHLPSAVYGEGAPNPKQKDENHMSVTFLCYQTTTPFLGYQAT